MEEEVSEQSIALDPGRHRDSWNRPKAYCLALYGQQRVVAPGKHSIQHLGDRFSENNDGVQSRGIYRRWVDAVEFA